MTSTRRRRGGPGGLPRCRVAWSARMLRVARSRAARSARWMLPLAGLAVVGGCGGGGGMPGNASASSTWTPGVFEPPSTFAALCAVPRSGTDPYNNNQPYPDRQGTATDENNWLRSWTHQLYLWYGEVQ